MKIKEIYDYINTLAPFDTAMDFDNCGLLVGDYNDEFTKVIVTLDVTDSVVEEAKQIGADLIISHHPIIFHPVKRISSKSTLYKLINSGIGCIAAHTNLDKAKGGVNTCLAEAIGLTDITDTDTECLFIGKLSKPISAKELALCVKKGLNCKGVRYTDTDKSIQTVAVASGAGGSCIYDAVRLGADALVTGEIKHHEIIDSAKNNIVIVDAGHYKTEDIVITPLINKLHDRFPNIEFVKSKYFTDNIDYI